MWEYLPCALQGVVSLLSYWCSLWARGGGGGGGGFANMEGECVVGELQNVCDYAPAPNFDICADKAGSFSAYSVWSALEKFITSKNFQARPTKGKNGHCNIFYTCSKL